MTAAKKTNDSSQKNQDSSKKTNDSSNYQTNGGNIGPTGPWALPPLGPPWALPPWSWIIGSYMNEFSQNESVFNSLSPTCVGSKCEFELRRLSYVPSL